MTWFEVVEPVTAGLAGDQWAVVVLVCAVALFACGFLIAVKS